MVKRLKIGGENIISGFKHSTRNESRLYLISAYLSELGKFHSGLPEVYLC